jgi:large subunit ribosomal protein L17
MRHAKKKKKLATSASHRSALLRNLAAQIVQYRRVKTTEAKAKAVKPVIEKLITLGKRGDLHARRQALAILGKRDLVHKVFTEIAPQYEDRNGGYTRILKLGPRAGDAAPMVFIELV